APAPGDALTVEIAGRPQPLFAGDVTVVERSYAANANRLLRLRAYDALHRLRKRQSTRLLEATDLAGLAAALSAGTGLQVSSRAAGHAVGPVYQCGRSDLAVLAEICSRAGRYPVVAGDQLLLVPLSGNDDGEPLELELGVNLHSAELELSQEPSFRSADVAGWHPDPAAAVRGRAEDRGARAEVKADPAPAIVGGGGPLQRRNELHREAAAAEALGQAELDVRSAAEATAELVADGDPALRPGQRIRLRGVAAEFEGTYTVCTAAHKIDATGYESAVSTRPPGPPAARAADVATLGIVTGTEDPQQLGRVRVSLPAYPDLATAWAPVLVAGAGPDKGAVVLPATGDHVLTLLLAADPGNAVVLGGLYGTHQAPDAAVPGPRGGRYTLRTADGQQVMLDGAGHRLALADGHGSTIELGPDLLRISSATDLTLEAPGQALRIRARSVDFEEAP
ncbi:hypothetical protein D477_021333, partial [Arthrobacter crystallopoietes BAB-32]